MTDEDTVEADDEPSDGEAATAGEETGLLAQLEETDIERWAEAVVTGATTYVMGYLITAAFFFVGPADPGKDLTFTQQLGKVGVVFNAAHFVDVAASHPVIVVAQGQTTDLGSKFSFFRLADLLGAEQAIPKHVYLAVTIVLLLMVGASRAWRLSRSEDRSTVVSSTVGMAAGYGALAYLGTVLFSYPMAEVDTVDGAAIVATQAYQVQGNTLGRAVLTFAPDGGGAILTGLLYPVAFATMGAIVGIAIREKHSESRADTDAASEPTTGGE